MIGDTLLYVVLPLYHQDFGISLAMVGVLLSLNRWIRLLANSGVAAIGERVGPHALMVMAAVGSVVSTTLYGLVENEAVQVAARMLWGISYASLNLSTLAYAVSDRANAGKRVGASRAAIGMVQALSLVGGAWIALQVGPRSVFLIFGGLTLISLVAALLLPRLPREIADKKPFRLPVPHRLEIWGFTLGFTGDGVFLLTLSFLMKDSITWVAPVLATAILLALRWLVEITTGPLGGWIGDRFGARRISIVNGVLLVAGFALIALDHELLGALVDRHDARHVQHPDPGAGARARQVERAELAGELFDLARLRRRARAAVGALAVPQHPADAALCRAGRGARHQCVFLPGAAVTWSADLEVRAPER